MSQNKKVSIYDIAHASGFSTATVSMVLNGKSGKISKKTQETILKTASQLNYIPNFAAKALNTDQTKTIGVLIPDITNPFFAQISRAIEDTAEQHGYNVILCNSDNNISKEQNYIKLLIGKQVDGVILASGSPGRESIDLLKKYAIPLVLLDRYIHSDEKGVFCDNYSGTEQGTEYLISKGRKKIVYVSHQNDLPVFHQRIDGFKKVMNQHKLCHKDMIFKGYLSLQGGMTVTKKILSTVQDVDAIFYCSDLMAMGGIKVLLREKIAIPKQIAVMGYDNIQISECIEPELTTVAQPIYEMACQSCEMLINFILGKETGTQIIFKPKIIERATV